MTVTPDVDGSFGPTTFTPCGVTTHGSTESDVTCTESHVIHNECRKDQVGELHKGGRWYSTKVIVAATAVRPSPHGKERKTSGPKSYDSAMMEVGLAAVSWPLKVTNQK
ncbi:hypothetical protein [Streptomyces sp. NBC_01207]|uniref:hypothetical protein n=1 Tax=Streptomyces sp. NBC_01207 TaxID=2903772 RepID=UPI002E1292D5|nr:hypothetical protein OG457_44940 [Streptomyces sp. NBC_01207]